MKRRRKGVGGRSFRAVVSWVVLLAFLATAVLPLPALAGDAVFYYHNDPTGSPVAITDAAGNKVWGADYEPFGEIAGLVENVPNNQQFLAKTVDPETSLHLLGARYYDGKLGRFLSVDQGLLRGREAGFFGHPQSQNLYVYSTNNPYRYVDPTGNTPFDIAFLLFDVAQLGIAISSGVGVPAAAIDVGLSIAGVLSPVPGVGEAAKIGRAAGHAADAVRGAGKATDGVSVYKSVDKAGNVEYVGITNDIERRAAEHLRQGGREIESIPGLSNPSRSDAKAVEQALIEAHGLSKDGGSLSNKINSIAKTNPDYAKALERGAELLKQSNVPGF